MGSEVVDRECTMAGLAEHPRQLFSLQKPSFFFFFKKKKHFPA